MTSPIMIKKEDQVHMVDWNQKEIFNMWVKFATYVHVTEDHLSFVDFGMSG